MLDHQDTDQDLSDLTEHVILHMGKLMCFMLLILDPDPENLLSPSRSFFVFFDAEIKSHYSIQRNNHIALI